METRCQLRKDKTNLASKRALHPQATCAAARIRGHGVENQNFASIDVPVNE
jgi:hypothetical protein